MQRQSRWLEQRIDAFPFDDPAASDPFSRRLARENGWSLETARRVLREYRRFLVLAVSADQPVTPSDAVDQAWHLHITYTAEYRRFCRDVLGRELDHTPSAGGPTEREHYVRNYERTRASYYRRFHELPPEDLWPPARRRFGSDLLARRVNLTEHWVFRKPRVVRALSRHLASLRPGRLATRALLVGLGVSSVACAAELSVTETRNGPEFLRIYLVLWLTTLCIAWALRLHERKWVRPTTELPELDPHEVAALGGGSDVALDAAIATLVERGAVEWNRGADTVKSVREPIATDPPFEGEVHLAIAHAGESSLTAFRARSGELSETIMRRLRTLGLVLARSSGIPLWLALSAPVVGSARVVSRLGSEKPVGFLVALCSVGFLLALVWFRRRPVRTGLGEATLTDLRRRHEALRSSASSSELATSGMLPLAVGLFGAAALDLSGGTYAGLLDRPASPYSGYGSSGVYGGLGGDGCSGGDSGGDSGGGCGGGGCGGCGGGGGD